MTRLTLMSAVIFAAACGNEPPSMPADPPVPPTAEESAAAAAATTAPAEPAADAGAFVPAPDGAKAMFTEPADGATVSSPVKVVFAVEGMEVKPAADATPNSGHHHIIVDGGPIALGTPVPADDTHIHYGTGAMEAEVELSPGEHTLTMQFADLAHRSYGEQLAATIKVTVEGEAAAPAEGEAAAPAEGEAAAPAEGGE